MKKFDFRPMQWVLARDADCEEWTLCQFSHYTEDEMFPYSTCGGSSWNKCIPYKGNKHLLGTTDPYVEPYEPKDGDFVQMKMTEEDKDYFLMIYHEVGPRDIDYYYACMYIDCEGKADHEVFINSSCRCNIFIPATEEEKQLLLSKLRNIGKDWNAEKKEIVDYVPPYEPKDGDFVYAETITRDKFIYIKAHVDDKTSRYVSFCISSKTIYLTSTVKNVCEDGLIAVIRPATEDEKNEFLSKLHEIGKDWNEEKKEVVDWRWKPEMGERYYYPNIWTSKGGFSPCPNLWSGLYDSVDDFYYGKGWVFRTKEECQAMCDKLNAAIKDVK